jgi:hypothetical protein
MDKYSFDGVVKNMYLQQPDKNYIDDKLVIDISLLIKEYIKNNQDVDHVAISALDSLKSAEISFISMLMNQADMKGYVNFSDKK